MIIRPAETRDVPAIVALMAPEIASGKLLPRTVRPEEFLVGTSDSDSPYARPAVIGAVGLSALTAGSVELGSLVTRHRGLGHGRALVEAAMDAANQAGFSRVVALTDAADFFYRCGFYASADTPWLRARAARGMETATPLTAPSEVSLASRARAETCVSCPRLAACRQQLVVRRIARAKRSLA